MESDCEEERIPQDSLRISRSDDVADNKKRRRPLSSYGSMKSDSEELEGLEEEMKEREEPSAVPHEGTRLQLIRSESPETTYTMTTRHSKPPGAPLLQTRPNVSGWPPEEDEEDEDDEDDENCLITNSPEPPDVIEADYSVQSDENGQPGRLHPEHDLPHIFKSVQSVVSELSTEEFHHFKVTFHHWGKKLPLTQIQDEDVLNFVDKAIEVVGRDQALLLTVRCLEFCKYYEKFQKLQNLCKRALSRISQKTYLIRKYELLREGVVKAGCHNLLQHVYVEPEISTSGCGGVDPSHELRGPHPTSFALAGADTFVSVNNLFRLQKDNGAAVRTVVTTGLPGSGMSVSVAKFCLDWAQEKANRDLQFVIKLSFRKLWSVRCGNMLNSEDVSITELIQYFYPHCKDMTYLEEEGCKFLIVMDSFDCYRAALDWENAPVIEGNHTKAHPDHLVVNIIRGNVLRGAHVWILGRRAAVSQIPSGLIDVVTEIQGFSDEMKEDFLSKRTECPELNQQIVTYFKRLPALVRLARHPFVCWMVFTVFKGAFQYQDFGEHRPRLTPFYINLMMVQMNRRLQFYYEQCQNKLDWSAEDKNLLLQMADMALQMLQDNTAVFSEDDVKRYGLSLTEVTVLSGMCTELPAAAPDGQRQFCFLNAEFQEFLAALYVFTRFRTGSRYILDSRHLCALFKNQPKSAEGLIQAALTQTFSSHLGQYDMFLRFLCGLLNEDCHNRHLCGFLFPHSIPKVNGLDKAEQLLRKTIQTAPQDRLENLKECLREMTQKDL